MIKKLVVVASGGALAFALAGVADAGMAWASVHPAAPPTIRDSMARPGKRGHRKTVNPPDTPTVRGSMVRPAAPPTIRDSIARMGDPDDGGQLTSAQTSDPDSGGQLTSAQTGDPDDGGQFF